MAGKIALKARPIGVGRVLRNFLTASAALPDDTLDAQRELGRHSEVIFGAHAPHKSGRLIRGIASIVLGGKVIVKDEARNPTSGYDYVGVTRFGHGKIVPKNRQFGATVLATGKRRGYTPGHAALRFMVGGRVVYAAYINEWRPASDWATDALPEVAAEAQAVATRLGHTIESRF